MKRNLALTALLAVIALILVGPAAPASAESHEEMASPQPIIWVSFLKSAPGASQTLIASIIENNTALYEQMLTDGKMLEWGVAQPILHSGNDPYNVVEWATFADWSGLDTFVGGFMARQAAMSPEERAATQEEYMAMTVAGSHADWVLQSIHTTTNGQRPGYLVIGYQKARPGKFGAMAEMWQSQVRPVYEKLMSDGAIQGFGLFTRALHGEAGGWTHGSWAAVPALASMGAINKGFASLRNEETMKKLMEMADWEAHSDEVLVVVHYDNAQL